ncbi:CRISPR-associated endonuclease Cas2 [Acidithiobacillus caldus]|nr:CRISPR-associated endonuclease Cas2 [Acidithiobacillus caldus]
MDRRKPASAGTIAGMMFWERTASSLWLLTYDIPDPCRLQRVAKIASHYGVRWQQSVFGLALPATKRQQLLQNLQQTIDTKVDDVQLFHLPPGTRLGSNVPQLAAGDFLSISGPE